MDEKLLFMYQQKIVDELLAKFEGKMSTDEFLTRLRSNLAKIYLDGHSAGMRVYTKVCGQECIYRKGKT